MAVQASLLDDTIPMAAGRSAQVVTDPTASFNKGLQTRANIVEEGEGERQIAAANDDRGVIQSYMQQGGDLYTPVGLDKAMTDLKGKISPEAYAKFAAHHDDVKQKDLKYKSDLDKMTGEELTNHATQAEQTVTAFSLPLDTYAKTKATKGEADAQAEFEKSRAGVVTQLTAAKGPNGQPLYPPEMVAALQSATPDTLTAMLTGTKYHQAQIKAKLEEAETQKARSQAGVEDARADVYRKNGTLGTGRVSDFEMIDRDVAQGRITKEEGEMMKKGQVARKSAPGEVSRLSEDAVKDAATKYYLNGDLPPRMSPAERSMILNAAAVVARENGDTSEEASIRQSANKASRVALTDITKRAALIESFEKDADKRLGLVVELARKADQNGVPAVTRWVNAGRQNIEGDPDVTAFNSAMTSAQAEVAKIMSASLGNAASSDSARAEAATMLNKYFSIDQIDAVIPNIRREFKFKVDSLEGQKKEIMDSMRTPNSQHRIADAGDKSKVAPEEQKKRDSDAATLLRTELTKSRAELAKIDPQDPELADKRLRLKGDIDATLREMKQSGFPENAPTAAAPAVGNQHAGPAGPYTDADKEARYQAWKKSHGGG